MRHLALYALAGSVLTLGAAVGASAQPASQDPCFLTRNLRGHTVGTDGNTLYFNVDGRDTYKVTTTNSCLAHATASDTLLVRDRGLGKICHPMDLEVIVRGNHCIIGKLTRMTPEEASALPKKLQP